MAGFRPISFPWRKKVVFDAPNKHTLHLNRLKNKTMNLLRAYLYILAVSVYFKSKLLYFNIFVFLTNKWIFFMVRNFEFAAMRSVFWEQRQTSELFNTSANKNKT